MKKFTGIITGVFILGIIGSLAWAADVVRMKFGHVAPPIHAQHKASEYFAKYVEKESGGRIKCSTHPRGQLGSHIQMLESLQVGTLEMVSVAGSGNDRICARDSLDFTALHVHNGGRDVCSFGKPYR